MKTTLINHNIIKKMAYTAIGIALYVVVSMLLKIPVVGHISLDLGYIVLAVYCMKFGAVSGAIVGAFGCTLVSLLASGWFPFGWLLGNAVIGFVCGKFYSKNNRAKNVLLTISAVLFGVLVIKTVVECAMFSIPFAVKIPKNGIAAVMDAAVMCVGLLVADKLTKRV